MKKHILCFAIIVLLNAFTACSNKTDVQRQDISSQDKVSISEIQSSSQQTDKLNTNSSEEDDIYQDYYNTLEVDKRSEKMNIDTLKRICQRVGGLSMMKPTGYEFEDIKQVPFDKLNWYFRSAAFDYPFYEKISDENVRLQAGALYLNYEQTMEIIKNELEIDYFPFQVSNKEKLKVDISAGPDPHCDFLYTIKKGDTITIQAYVEVVEKTTIRNPGIFVRMEYVFKSLDNDNVMPISARRI